jgi:hypothetical protein
MISLPSRNVGASNNVPSATCTMSDADKPKIEELADLVAFGIPTGRSVGSKDLTSLSFMRIWRKSKKKDWHPVRGGISRNSAKMDASQ